MATQKKQSQFLSLVWYDEAIDFLFRFVAKSSEPLLAAGLIYSAANVLSRGGIGGADPILNNAWAITQAIAIESSGGVLLVQSIESFREKDALKAYLYFTLSVLLAITGGIMLFMQLAGWEQQGNSPFMLCLFGLRCIVSVGYIYLCRTKHIRFTGIVCAPQSTPVEPAITLEDVRAVVLKVISTTITSEQQPDQLQIAAHTTTAQESEQVLLSVVVDEEVASCNAQEGEVGSNNPNYERVKVYLSERPGAKVREVSTALGMSVSTASKWMQQVKKQR